ncbi:unnamed protein product [Effrenium voratum]|nr:unnamed protein product [Effrenium voratum]
MAMRLPLLAALLHPALGTGELTEVIIGSSYEIGHKCVKPAGAVHCPSRLSGIGHLPDEFDIYQLPSGEVCAKRTDYHGGWSVHVRVKCRKASDWEGAGGGEHLQVDIGTNPDSALKCVADPGHVDCDDTVEQIGRTGEWPDKFHIYHEGAQICARRVDHDGGWGLNLILQCRPRRAFAGGAHVQIGTSPDSAVKCVADPGHVHCDDTAEQVGRTGEWPDTFHIYHADTQMLCLSSPQRQ